MTEDTPIFLTTEEAKDILKGLDTLRQKLLNNFFTGLCKCGHLQKDHEDYAYACLSPSTKFTVYGGEIIGTEHGLCKCPEFDKR